MKPQVKPPVARNEAGQIIEGHTANPGGQPKWVNEVKSALQQCAADGAAFLHDVIADKAQVYSVADRLRAVDIAFAYTMPKPKQLVEHSGAISPRASLQALPDAQFDAATEAALDASPESQH